MALVKPLLMAAQSRPSVGALQDTSSSRRGIERLRGGRIDGEGGDHDVAQPDADRRPVSATVGALEEAELVFWPVRAGVERLPVCRIDGQREEQVEGQPVVHGRPARPPVGALADTGDAAARAGVQRGRVCRIDGQGPDREIRDIVRSKASPVLMAVQLVPRFALLKTPPRTGIERGRLGRVDDHCVHAGGDQASVAGVPPGAAVGAFENSRFVPAKSVAGDDGSMASAGGVNGPASLY